MIGGGLYRVGNPSRDMWSLSLLKAQLALLARALSGCIFGCLGGCLLRCSGSAPLGGAHGGDTPFNGPTSGNEEGGGPSEDGGPEGGEAGTARDAGDATVTAMAAIDGAHAPTWTAIYDSYLMTCGTCHNQMTASPSAYTWLEAEGYISGTTS